MGIIINGSSLSAENFTPQGDVGKVPTVVTRGLRLWLDAGNYNSYINTTNYYDCGYGCKYYATNPGCTSCDNKWNDLSGYGNDWGVTGTFKGHYFDYIGNAQNRSASTDWRTTDELTIDTWFNPASGGVNTACCATIFGRYWFRFFMIGQSIYLMIGFANPDGTYNTYQHPSFTIPYDQWCHIVGVRRGNNYIFWINGSEVYNTTFGSGLILHDPGGQWYISDGSHNSIKYGSLKIYNRGLTSEEILQNFNNGRIRYGI